MTTRAVRGGTTRRFAVSAAAAVLAIGPLVPAVPAAKLPDTRTISFYNIHTKETLSVLYKRKGQYVPDAMAQIDWILRDWRANEKTTMDPATIDILWEMHTELGSREPIHVISGYRSRGTNDMLRRTVGGQASQSQHTTGKAVDVTFPDVPLKQIRYAALIREQGGVGYYPTSGIPFIHVDTGRVRAWPRLPRYELALLFPGGASKHAPADGDAITREDVKVAQARHRDLATQIAAFFDLRRSPKPQLPGGAPAGPAAGTQVAALTPPAPAPGAAPQLVAAPKPVERPARPPLSAADRSELDALIASASRTATALAPPDATLAAADSETGPPPGLVRGPMPVTRPRQPAADLASVFAPSGAPRTSWMQLAALDPATLSASTSDSPDATLTDAVPPGWGTGYAAAPAFDEEHPEELHYRPFPIAPLLTLTPSIDDPAIATLTAPDVRRIAQLIDQPVAAVPMRFLPGRQTAETLWAQEFKGQLPTSSAPSSVASSLPGAGPPSETASAGFPSRGVRTTTAAP